MERKQHLVPKSGLSAGKHYPMLRKSHAMQELAAFMEDFFGKKRCKSHFPYQAYLFLAEMYEEKNKNPSEKDFHPLNYIRAAEFYQKAMLAGTDKKEKAVLVEKIKALYDLGSREQVFFHYREEAGSYFDNQVKSRAYRDLAVKAKDEDFKVYLLEKALEYVPDETAGAEDKYRDILGICDVLEDIYRRQRNRPAYERICARADEAALFLSRAEQFEKCEKEKAEVCPGPFSKSFSVQERI